MSDQLPEGYKRVEYIRIEPSKLLLLGGFHTIEQAIRRKTELYEKCPSSDYDIRVNVIQTIEDFDIVIPEKAICQLTDDEKKRLRDFRKQLSIHEYCPIVYRFIDETFVDSFFATGALRLSTFKKCAKLEDANRKDKKEGRARLVGHEKEMRIKMEMGTGENAILLCSSLSINNVKADGEADNCCIEIRDVNGFVATITNTLIRNGLQIHTVLKGPCVYSDRMIETTIRGNITESIIQETQSSSSLNFQKLLQLGTEIADNNIFFCKPVENRVENEYRMLWLLEDDVTQETYDIVAPEARQYCRKIRFDGPNKQVR